MSDKQSTEMLAFTAWYSSLPDREPSYQQTFEAGAAWQTASNPGAGRVVPENQICPTAPDCIWLQVDPECEADSVPLYPGDEVTWCEDKINDSDTLYIRADLAEPDSPHPASRAVQPDYRVHSCSYFCDNPACIKQQRDEMRDKAVQLAKPRGTFSLDFAKVKAAEWQGQAGGELLPQLTANELAGLLTEVCNQPANPLTAQEIKNLWDEQLFCVTDLSMAIDFVRDIEAAHNIKPKEAQL